MIARFSKFISEGGDAVLLRHDNIRYVWPYDKKGPGYSVIVLDSSEQIIVFHTVESVLLKLREDSKN